MNLPSPLEIKCNYPGDVNSRAFLAESRKKAEELLLRKDPRLLICVGPCSIHDIPSCLEYASLLRDLQKKVEDSLFLVMRVYLEKPRTSLGWKGFIYDPELSRKSDLAKGIVQSRQLLLELTQMKVPTATEFLEPLLSPYIEDLITWGFIGARTSTSQIHRQLGSLFSFPIGFKNSVDGGVHHAVNACLAASKPQDFAHINEHGRVVQQHSLGNSLTHIVLRGSEKKYNYDPHSVQSAQEMLRTSLLPERILIDCAHGNSQKIPKNQVKAFHSVLEQLAGGNNALFGIMLESHLHEGNQPLIEDPSLLKYGYSITDPCLSWKKTEELLLEAHERLSSIVISSVQS